jgi:hypothetical protein
MLILSVLAVENLDTSNNLVRRRLSVSFARQQIMLWKVVLSLRGLLR